MAKDNRKDAKFRMEVRQRKVANMYFQGFTQVEIADKVQVTQATVSTDLRAIRKRIVAETNLEFGERQALELAKIDRVERMAYEAYAKSCQAFVTRKVSQEQIRVMVRKAIEGKDGSPGVPAEYARVPGKKAVEVTRKGQAPGDPRWLEMVLKCIAERCKVVGLYREQEGSTTNNVFLSWDAAGKAAASEAPPDVEETLKALEGKFREARDSASLGGNGIGGANGHPQ